MSEWVERVLPRNWPRASTLWRIIGRRLRDARLIPPSPAIPVELEHVVEAALSPVEPSAAFRAKLRDNLGIAAQRQLSGYTIEYPKPYRAALILSFAALVFTTTMTTVVLLCRARLTRGAS